MGAESKTLQQFDPGQLNIADQPVLGGKEDAYGTNRSVIKRTELEPTD